MQLTELQTDLLEALRALTDWGRDNTSPRDPNNPHSLLVRAAGVIAEADRLRAEAEAEADRLRTEDTLTYTLANGHKVVHHRITDADALARQPAGATAIITDLWRFIEDDGDTEEFFALRERVRNYYAAGGSAPRLEILEAIDASIANHEQESPSKLDAILATVRRETLAGTVTVKTAIGNLTPDEASLYKLRIEATGATAQQVTKGGGVYSVHVTEQK